MNMLYPDDSTSKPTLARSEGGRAITFKVDDSLEILSDKNGKGKERDWKGKKKRSLLMAKHHAAVEELAKKAERMYDCGNYLVFKMKDGTLKLYQAYFCKARLCPMCNWRRSLKVAFQNKRIIKTVNER